MNKIETRRYAAWAVSLFFVVSAIIVTSHWLRLGGVELGASISKHVGFAVYSSVLFAIANTITVVLLVRHINQLYKSHDFSKLWLMTISAMATAMLITSYFPLTGEMQLIDNIHRASSWTVFGLAIVFAIITFCSVRTRVSVLVSGIFLAFGAACLMWFMAFSDFFWGYVLILESLFILLAFLFILSIPTKPKRLD
jgi:hypothetical protein